MRAQRDVDVRRPYAPMPAAMLPCPAPAGSDWSFQNPVGVDCSSPEPRCIWLAVLRRAAGSAPPPTLPSGPHEYQPRVRLTQPSVVCRWTLAVSLRQDVLLSEVEVLLLVFIWDGSTHVSLLIQMISLWRRCCGPQWETECESPISILARNLATLR